MNIFFLDINPTTCAHYYFNKHCVKIILEIAQMLYVAHWCTNTTNWIQFHIQSLDEQPYRKTHANHPTAKWVRQCLNNYRFACELGLALCEEYTLRFKKTHKTQKRIKWLYSNPPTFFDTSPINAFFGTLNVPPGCTPIPLAMPDIYHSEDVIESYRTYYIYEKESIAETHEKWSFLCKQWNM